MSRFKLDLTIGSFSSSPVKSLVKCLTNISAALRFGVYSPLELGKSLIDLTFDSKVSSAFFNLYLLEFFDNDYLLYVPDTFFVVFIVSLRLYLRELELDFKCSGDLPGDFIIKPFGYGLTILTRL